MNSHKGPDPKPPWLELSHGTVPSSNEHDDASETADFLLQESEQEATPPKSAPNLVSDCATIWSVLGFMITTSYTAFEIRFAITGNEQFTQVRRA